MPVGHDEVGDNEDLGDGDLSDNDNLSDNVEQEELSSANAQEEDLSPAPPRQRLRLLQRRRGKKAQTSPTFNVVTGRGGRGGAASPLGSPTRAPPGRGRGRAWQKESSSTSTTCHILATTTTTPPPPSSQAETTVTTTPVTRRSKRQRK